MKIWLALALAALAPPPSAVVSGVVAIDFEADDARAAVGGALALWEIVGNVGFSAPDAGHSGRALICHPVSEEQLRCPGALIDESAGSVSLWVKCRLEDLPPLHVNLWHINSGRWNDGSLFVDITPAPPRVLRFASYPSSGEIGQPLVIAVPLNTPLWRDGQWNHVSAEWSGFNAPRGRAAIGLSLNGTFHHASGEGPQTLHLPSDARLLIGVNFTGLIDEIRIRQGGDPALVRDERLP